MTTAFTKQTNRLSRTKHRSNNSGASLILVLIILTVVSLLGVAGMQISMMSERGARNDRDRQIAWQAAEAALLDAEFDIFGPANPNPARRKIFTDQTNDDALFTSGCGTSGDIIGLCKLVNTGKPVWLTVDFTATGPSAPTTAFGTYTGRTFSSGLVGIQPNKPPRYVIEPIEDPESPTKSKSYIYRVTAMGFGPRPEIQAVTQMIYRK